MQIISGTWLEKCSVQMAVGPRPVFSNMAQGMQAVPAHNCRTSDICFLFFTGTLLHEIIAETITYARQFLERHPILCSGSKTRSWENITLGEIKDSFSVY